MLNAFQKKQAAYISGLPEFRHWCIDPHSSDPNYQGPVQFTWYTKDLTLHTQRMFLDSVGKEITVPHKEYL